MTPQVNNRSYCLEARQATRMLVNNPSFIRNKYQRDTKLGKPDEDFGMKIIIVYVQKVK